VNAYFRHCRRFSRISRAKYTFRRHRGFLVFDRTMFNSRQFRCLLCFQSALWNGTRRCRHYRLVRRTLRSEFAGYPICNKHIIRVVQTTGWKICRLGFRDSIYKYNENKTIEYTFIAKTGMCTEQMYERNRSIKEIKKSYFRITYWLTVSVFGVSSELVASPPSFSKWLRSGAQSVHLAQIDIITNPMAKIFPGVIILYFMTVNKYS